MEETTTTTDYENVTLNYSHIQALIKIAKMMTVLEITAYTVELDNDKECYIIDSQNYGATLDY